MSLPALLGGEPVAVDDTYPAWPQWGDREREELLGTLESGAWWTGDGQRAFRFARQFAAFQGAAGGLPFMNGTATLEAALVACGIGEGDEVIVPGMTFVASATSTPRRSASTPPPRRPPSPGGRAGSSPCTWPAPCAISTCSCRSASAAGCT
jgi:hypothetical protein